MICLTLNKRCHCNSESFVWHGKYCLKAKYFGEICKDQSECSKSGDPHLQCLSTNDGQNRHTFLTSNANTQNCLGICRGQQKRGSFFCIFEAQTGSFDNNIYRFDKLWS